MGNGTMSTRIPKQIRQKRARAVGLILFRMAENLPPSRFWTENLWRTYAPDRMPSIPSSRTASSCVIKLWPKSVRSPPGTTHFSVRPENAPAGPRGMSGGSPVLERPHPPESCGSAIAKVLPQQESLDFPRHGFRQFTAESHFTGHFVGRQSCFHALTNLGRQGIRTSGWFAQHHISDRVGEP